jgi:hypothetical protein
MNCIRIHPLFPYLFVCIKEDICRHNSLREQQRKVCVCLSLWMHIEREIS